MAHKINVVPNRPWLGQSSMINSSFNVSTRLKGERIALIGVSKPRELQKCCQRAELCSPVSWTYFMSCQNILSATIIIIKVILYDNILQEHVANKPNLLSSITMHLYTYNLLSAYNWQPSHKIKYINHHSRRR